MKWDEVLDEFSKEFLKRREAEEEFDASKHSFYIHDPEMQYLSMLFTGYVSDFYYMTAKEVFQLAYPLHRVILDKDPEYHLMSLRVARAYGAMKDQVLIGLLLWSKHPEREKHKDELTELLASFPPNQIVKKFINTKRKTPNLFGGLGIFEKKLLQNVIKTWEEQGKLPYYFAKYRHYIQQLINLTHMKVNPAEFSYLSNPTRYEGNTDYLKQISEFLRTKDISNLPENAPFELVRSSIKKEEWTPEVLEKCDITGNTVVLQACSLYSVFGDKILPYIKRAVSSPTVTADKILKALVMASDKYDNLTEALAQAYAEKVKETYKQLLLPLPEMPRICMVIDASGSMNPGTLGGMFLKAIACTAPFAPLVKKLILFSDNANYEDEKLLSSYEGIVKLLRTAVCRYDSGTDIAAGLKLALEQAKTGEINTVILATDEQANILKGEETEMDLIRKLLNMDIRVIVLNPTPYPVHVSDIREKRLIYIPAPNPEAVTGALRLIQLRKELQEAGARELIQKLAVIKKKKERRKGFTPF